MPRSSTRRLQEVWSAIRLLLVFTVLLGVVYPLALTAFGAVALPAQSNGSLLQSPEGEVLGSTLLGQSFLDSDGSPLAEYFQPRPSAAGEGHDPRASGGSNLGPESTDLLTDIATRRAQIAEFNDVPASAVPADAVTASASGLDPHISPEYAHLQVRRVAEARGLPVSTVESLVSRNTAEPDLGMLGDARVNVVELNAALDALSPR